MYYHPRTRDSRELQGENRYAAGSEGQYALTAGEGTAPKRVPRGERGARKSCPLFEGKVLRKQYQAALVEENVLCQHSVYCSASCGLRCAFGDLSTDPCLKERAGDSIPRFPTRDAFTDCYDLPCSVGEGNQRERKLARVLSLYHEQIAIIERRSLHSDQHLSVRRLRHILFGKSKLINAESFFDLVEFHP